MRNFQGIVFIWTQTYSEIFLCMCEHTGKVGPKTQHPGPLKWDVGPETPEVEQ